MIEADSGNSSIGGTPAREEDWTLDQLGNWPGFVVKAAGMTTLNQTRTHNAVNEITDLTVWPDPTHDAAGNLTLIPQAGRPGGSTGKSDALKYDAWNRPVEYKDDDSAAVLQTNEPEYDSRPRLAGSCRLSTDFSTIPGSISTK